MYEGTYAPGFHDLVFGILRDVGIIPNVRQTSGEMRTLISRRFGYGCHHSASIGSQT
jgi:hypothetical protein